MVKPKVMKANKCTAHGVTRHSHNCTATQHFHTTRMFPYQCLKCVLLAATSHMKLNSKDQTFFSGMLRRVVVTAGRKTMAVCWAVVTV